MKNSKFSCIELNNKSEKTILFIHGIYSSPGFWLNHINSFEEFKLLLLNINYIDYSFNSILDYLKQIFNNNNIDYIISHSMGSLFALHIGNIYKIKSYDICPYYLSKISNIDAFSNFLFSIYDKKISKDKIQADIEFIERKFFKYKQLVDAKLNTIFLPDGDTCFDYSMENSSYIYQGNHFDIKNAISAINSFILLDDSDTKI